MKKCKKCNKPVRRTIEDLGYCKGCLVKIVVEWKREQGGTDRKKE